MTIPFYPKPTQKNLKRYGKAMSKFCKCKKLDIASTCKASYYQRCDKVINEFTDIKETKGYKDFKKKLRQDPPEFNPIPKRDTIFSDKVCWFHISPTSDKLTQPKPVYCCDVAKRRGLWWGLFLGVSGVFIGQLIWFIIN